jgi:CRP-like cAMP-binding protein
MDDIRQSATSNRLLSTLSAGDFALLQPHLRRRTVQLHQILVEAGEPIELVYFPESGILSIVASEIGEIEVGVVGNEGCVGAAVLLDVDRSSVTAFGQMPGQGLTIPATALREAAARSRTLQRSLLRYVHAFWVQTAETAYANARCTVEQRLARCLLMYHDRTDGNELTVTHECLATMLGVRRPGVTVATHVLEGEGLIRAKRGRITILDRPKLESAAGGSYRAAVAAYERIVAPATRRGPLPTFAPLHVASI